MKRVPKTAKTVTVKVYALTANLGSRFQQLRRCVFSVSRAVGSVLTLQCRNAKSASTAHTKPMESASTVHKAARNVSPPQSVRTV